MRRRARGVALAVAASLVIPLAGCGTPAAAPVTDVAVAGLEADGGGPPLGIDTPAPVLTWRLTSSRRGVLQSGYRVVVARTARAAAAGRGDVWDSGRVAAAAMAVTYGGPALRPRTRYFWSVRAWAPDAGAWAPPAWFETALTAPGQWRGTWIAGPPRRTRVPTAAQGRADDGCCAANPAASPAASPTTLDLCRPTGGETPAGRCTEVRPAVELRRAFDVEPAARHGTVVAARLYAAGLGAAEPTLNGRLTAPGDAVNPLFTAYDKTVLYTTDDVTALVRQDPVVPARNVVAARLGAGRYDNESTQKLGHGWERAPWRAQEALRADLVLTYADGTAQTVATDGSWQASADGPVRYADVDLGETYDARRERPGWDTPSFDATGWSAARAVPGPAGVPRAQRDRNRVVTTVEAPRGGFRRLPSKGGTATWDAGRQRTGWATVAVSGARPGTPVEIRYAERAAADPPPSRGSPPDPALQTDYYVARGGTETYTPRFTYKGFQYVHVSGPRGTPLPPGVRVDLSAVQEVRTDLAATGTFTSSSRELTELAAAVRVSVTGNHVTGIVTDTPTYEKAGWTGDAALLAPTASLLLDTRRQYRKTAQDLVDAQRADGQVPMIVPATPWFGYAGPEPSFGKPADGGATPLWDQLLFVAPWEAYRRYGDTTALRTAYGAMRDYLLEWLPRWYDADRDGFDFTLTSGLGDWAAPTGRGAPPGTPPGEGTNFEPGMAASATSTAYVAYLAQVAAGVAHTLGDTEGEKRFTQLRARVRADFHARFYDVAGFYREDREQPFLQTVQALALSFDLVPRRRRAALQKQLVADVVTTRGGHQMSGIVGSRWILPALTDAAHEGVPGAAEAAYTIVKQTTYPSFGYWNSLGWTGLGEYWESDSRTRNHEMHGAVGQWLYESLAGLQPGAPGYRRVVVRPLVAAGIDGAAATYRSVRGPISAGWRRAPTGALTLEVTIPANTTATVHVPGRDPARVRESGVPAERAPAVTLRGTTKDAVVYAVGSGSYRFEVSPGG